MSQQYTNDVTSEMLVSLNQPSFTAEQLAGMNDDARKIIAEQEEYDCLHTVIAVCRFAAEGSVTRDGGVLKTGSSPLFVHDENGAEGRVGLVGDTIVYPDGTTATITSGAGKASCDNTGRGAVLVGSHLSNGDETIGTSQTSSFIVVHQGMSLSEGFLVEGNIAEEVAA